MRDNYNCEDSKILKRFKDSISDSLLICKYCGTTLKRDEATVDHLFPICRGGKTNENNLCISCKSCNREKDCLTDEEYISIKDNKEELYELINRVRTELEAIRRIRMSESKNLRFKGQKIRVPKDANGIVKISDLSVPSVFSELPKKSKIQQLRNFYEKFGRIDKPVQVKGRLIVNGYARYVLCQELNLGYVPIKRLQ